MITPITLGCDRLVRYSVDLAVDTGEVMPTMMLYDQYVRQLKLQDSRQHSVSGLAFGLNGFYPVALGSINSFFIGDAETHNVAVDYLAQNETAAAEQKLPGAIGNGILQNFRVVIFDVPQGRMFRTETSAAHPRNNQNRPVLVAGCIIGRQGIRLLPRSRMPGRKFDS